METDLICVGSFAAVVNEAPVIVRVKVTSDKSQGIEFGERGPRDRNFDYRWSRARPGGGYLSSPHLGLSLHCRRVEAGAKSQCWVNGAVINDNILVCPGGRRKDNGRWRHK